MSEDQMAKEPFDFRAAVLSIEPRIKAREADRQAFAEHMDQIGRGLRVLIPVVAELRAMGMTPQQVAKLLKSAAEEIGASDRWAD